MIHQIKKWLLNPYMLGFLISLIIIILYEIIIQHYRVPHTWGLRLILFSSCYSLVLLLIFIGQKIQKVNYIAAENVESEINQLQLLCSLNQLNPHFIFNAMNAISSLIMQEERQVAYRCMIMITKLMRYLLENSDKISCTLKDEIDFVKNYLEIERIRYNQSFTYNIKIDSKIDQYLLLPKLLLQLHVENAVKHGLVPKNGSKNLNIFISQNGKAALLKIEDNGIGRLASKQLNHDYHSTGSGYKISNKLIKLYNEIHRENVTLAIKDLYEKKTPSGTEVKISIRG